MKKENLQEMLKEAQDQLKQLDDRKLAKEVCSLLLLFIAQPL
jgi:hypothetical protein